MHVSLSERESDQITHAHDIIIVVIKVHHVVSVNNLRAEDILVMPTLDDVRL